METLPVDGLNSPEKPEWRKLDELRTHPEREEETLPKILETFNDEDRIGYVRFVLEGKESANRIKKVLDALQSAVGEEKASEIITEAKKGIKSDTENTSNETQ